MGKKVDLNEAVSFLYKKWGEIKPAISLICGSGWGELCEIFQNSSRIEYGDIPGMSSTTISGHNGTLILGKFKDKQILIFQGRRHFYEGSGWNPICFPIYLANALGVKTMILTNAAGGINKSFEVGDLMVLEDHINFMGSNPLIGPISHPKIPRFPDQTEIYCKELRNRIFGMTHSLEFPLRKGVYIALSGPSFETPAEIKAYQLLGADAVGMSTVPEAMMCNALNMKVIGISCISNLASGIASHELSHDDVQNASKVALPKMKKIILMIINTLIM